jgi:quercetin dioxygenase-like cupin family protein
MAQPGQSIASPPVGQVITFLETRESTGGELLEFEAVLDPGSRIPDHVHLHQEESWEGLEGEGTFWVRGQRTVLRPGGELTLAPGIRHRFRNESGAPTRVRVRLRPALRTEELFEALFELGRQGRTNRYGAPSPRQTARLLREHRDDFFYLSRIPPALQRAALAPLGRL